jgi:hypothetical protein
MSQIDSDYCRLRLAAENTVEFCPQELCAFWEPGGAVVPGGCILDRLGTDIRRRDVAAYLLEVRERVEHARDLARS